MTLSAARRIFTRRGPLDLNVSATARGFVAELPDGSLSAFARTEDEAVTRLALAADGRPRGRRWTG